MATRVLGAAANPLFAVVGYAFGTATGVALRPFAQDFANFAWSEHRVRPLSVQDAAALWVEGVWTPDRAKQEAAYSGFSDGRIEALHDLMDDPPDLAFLFELWRRDLIDAGKFREGLRHHRIETDYFDALAALHNRLLTPEQLANARQRGFMSAAEQHAEAALQGVTAERADVQFQLSGLPPPPDRAREMWRRGIIGRAEFEQAIVEGNEKLKYVDEEVALFRELLTPAQIVNQRLRGWRDTAWMNERLADHGYTAEDALDLFQGQGRPITNRQVFIGARRGGVYNGGTGGIDPAFLKSLQESNIRPEWYNLAWAQRHALPSAFVLRALTQAGDVTEVDAEKYLLWMGWPAELAAKVSAAWAGATGDGTVAVDPRVKSEVTGAITEIRNAYLIGQTDEAQARGWLSALGIGADVQDGMIPVWNVRREVPQKDLTAAQVKRAYRKLPDLWPRERALEALQLQGMTADDAATLLDE